MTNNNEIFRLNAKYIVTNVLDKHDDLCHKLDISIGDCLYINFRIVKPYYDKHEKQYFIDITNLNNNKFLNNIILSVFATIISNIKLQKLEEKR